MIVLQKDSQDARKRADKLMREADLVETDAAETRKDAEGLDMMVNMAVDAVDDAVKFAQVRRCFGKFEAGRFKQRLNLELLLFFPILQKSKFLSRSRFSGSRSRSNSRQKIYILSLNLTQNFILA